MDKFERSVLFVVITVLGMMMIAMMLSESSLDECEYPCTQLDSLYVETDSILQTMKEVKALLESMPSPQLP